MHLPNLFDLIGGPLLDKRLLAQGVRSGSMRRYAIAALLVRLFVMPAPTWPEVTAWALAVLGLDLQAAVLAAPGEAMKMLGAALGRARDGFTSAYSYSTGLWSGGRAVDDEQQL